MSAEVCTEAFQRRFGRPPDFTIRSPGRINLIGEHTDYNGGLVLPMSIDRCLHVAARAAADAIEVYSVRFDQTMRLSLDSPEAVSEPSWSGYVAGIITLLREQRVPMRGIQLCVGGDLPVGAGLASSAALEVGVALAMLTLAERRLSPTVLATLCRRAEQEYAKSPCGIMDQLCCTSAKAGHAFLIDCQSAMTEHVPLNLGDGELVVIDSGLRHAISGPGYAARRRECAAALATMSNNDPRMRSLRDITLDRLAAVEGHLDGTLAKRVRHVVTENARVARAVDALRAADVGTFGRLMVESHASLRDDFEVSCKEVDALVSLALEQRGVYGARMTGGGFGGCAIALVERGAVEALGSAIRGGYNGRFAAEATSFTVRSAAAAGMD